MCSHSYGTIYVSQSARPGTFNHPSLALFSYFSLFHLPQVTHLPVETYSSSVLLLRSLCSISVSFGLKQKQESKSRMESKTQMRHFLIKTCPFVCPYPPILPLSYTVRSFPGELLHHGADKTPGWSPGLPPFHLQ